MGFAALLVSAGIIFECRVDGTRLIRVQGLVPGGST